MSYFDQVASVYDSEFTKSLVGKYQRKLIQNELSRLLKGKTNLNILELNCGTGEDAAFLNQLGCQVWATDASAAMIAVCKKKYPNTKGLQFEQRRIENMEFSTTQKFDMVFSNFSGINMLDEVALKTFIANIQSHINTNGLLILVVFGKIYLPEILYYLIKGKWNKAFRRLKKSDVFSKCETIYYHSPNDIRELLRMEFYNKKIMPIGIVSPPSYLSPWFANKIWLFKFLASFDLMAKYLIPASCSDHCMIIASKK